MYCFFILFIQSVYFCNYVSDYSSEDRTPEDCEDEDGVYEDVGFSDKIVDRSLDRPSQTPYYYGDLLKRETTPNGPRMPPLRSTGAEGGELDGDEMSRQRNFYETAFDSRVSRSDDDLDVDVVINKCILPSGKPPPRPGSSSVAGPGIFTPERRRTNLSRQELVKKKPRGIQVRGKEIVDTITQDITNLDIQNSPLPLRGFVPPTPPSSAPLPTKFPSSHSMASVHSAPNLPGARIKDSRLPVKSLRCRLEDSRALEGRPKSFVDNSENRTEIRFGRPKSLFCPTDISEFKGRPEDNSRNERPTTFLATTQVLEIKGRPRRVRVKYSSTESMATSSSGGSLESIRSSTSEGNRSTSSSESHRSSSLSSHSSDSTGSTGFNQVVGTPMGARFFQQTKLHILSPISDKSSQEPGSETSENNKNNNSHGASPEENTLASTPVVEQSTWCQDNPSIQLQKPKRRTPQNKNLINLGLAQCSGDSETHQGSDSGISIESRCGVSGVHNQNVTVDLNDLPFDMPKLRRRRLLQQIPGCVQDNSGSATSVDLKDLPFDMPKLRRRLRGAPPSTESSGVSQASSSHSVQEAESRPVSSKSTLFLY